MLQMIIIIKNIIKERKLIPILRTPINLKEFLIRMFVNLILKDSKCSINIHRMLTH